MGGRIDLKRELESRIAKLEHNKSRVNKPQSIYDCIKRASPHLEPPEHLDCYVQALHEACRKGNVELCFAAPPQHGKTVVSKHGMAYFAIERPGMHHAYSTFNQEKAHTEMIDTKRICFELGLDPSSRNNVLTLSGDTVIQFVGCSTGELTGHPINGLHLIDDPIKDQKEAYSRTTREDRWNWFNGVAQTRRHPGSSVVAMMTRWHLDDLIGRLISLYGWRYTRLPAECDSTNDPNGRAIGEALWPKHRPIDWLQQFKRSPITWASMYQGTPRALGDTLFKDAVFYDELPRGEAYVPLYGCDLAYSGKTRSDWSVLLAGRFYRDIGKVYLTNMLREQVQADKFTDLMTEKWKLEKGRVLWFGSTTERGTADLIKRDINLFEYAQATVDKYARALPTADKLWNPGDILVPTKKNWSDQFTTEVLSFTGQGDATDDCIDALAALGHLVLGYDAVRYDGSVNRELRNRFKTARERN